MEQRQVEQRPDASGDYEYDQAHEQRGSGPHAHPAERRVAPAPAPRRPSEPDGDMSYDEAHDF